MGKQTPESLERAEERQILALQRERSKGLRIGSFNWHHKTKVLYKHSPLISAEQRRQRTNREAEEPVEVRQLEMLALKQNALTPSLASVWSPCSLLGHWRRKKAT